MKVIVFGATGTIGRLAVNKMLSDGNQVTAFARNPMTLDIGHPNLHRFAGDAMEATAVSQAVQGHDAVIITRKSARGVDFKVLERPGLWNGAMAGWNTVLVEVPLATFTPVKSVLDLLRPEAYIVNTARGGIIDEAALIKNLQAGKIAGAGLDVFEHEPAVNPKLVKLAEQGKVVILPHMGSATLEGRIDMGEKVIINIRTLFDGHRPPDRVLPGQV